MPEISDQEWKDWGKGKLPVPVLKRALVEVRDMCAASWGDCVKCPLLNQNAFECPIRNRFPSDWAVDHWKEDTHETD